jgi:translocation and assembly module TamB
LSVVPLLVPSVSSINGAIVANFDLGGRLAEPLLQGSAQLLAPRLELADIGLQLTDTVIKLDAANTRLLLDGSAVSGGRIELTGELLLNADKDWPFTMSLVGDDFIAMDLPSLQVFVSPDLKIERQAGALALTGALEIPKADILIRDLPAGTRSASRDVVVLRDDGSPQQTGQSTPVTTDINVILGDEVHVSALGFNGFVGGELRLRGNTGQPLQATGDVRIDQGTFRAYGQRLNIERGLFSYTNSPIDNPGINVKATREIGDVIVGVNALGTARRTTVTTFSSPSMSENDRISYLVVGKPAREGASLSLDREVAKNLSVGINVDTKTGESAFVTRYRILRTLHTEVGSSARSSTLDLFYTIERE